MAMHRSKRKKRPSSTPSLPIPSEDDNAAGRYGLREKRHRTWLLCDSSDDEYLTLVPKTECQLCFKVFASSDALSMHMGAHARQEQKMVARSRVEESREGNGFEGADATVSTPVVLTYGVQEATAARILLMLSGHSDDMCSASVEYCNEDSERDSNLADDVQESESQSGDDELMKPENCSPDGKMKFSSLSNVLKATAIHKCKHCSKVFTSGNALGGHQKFHKVRVHVKAQASPNSAVAETGQRLVEVDHRPSRLNLPSLSDRNYSSRIGKSELHLWWGASSIRSERMLGVV
jgi:hypothetical protein